MRTFRGANRALRFRFLVFLLILLYVPAALAGRPTAHEILLKAKRAMGGHAWDSIRSMRTEAKIATGGLSGTAESWTDVRTGRYVDRFQLGPVKGAEGFDGSVAWSQDSSGQSQVEGSTNGREAAVDEAYRNSLAYWFPQRWPATMGYPGERREGGKRYYVLRITPKGGRAFELWVDATTYRFDRTVEKGAIETRTVYFSDYRTVEGVEIPFSERSTNGDTRYDQVVTLEKVKFNGPVEDAQFRLPSPPPLDFALVGGKNSTTVPFELLNNHIYVHVELDGKGPFRVLCDTGGANIITPSLARELGLKPQGTLQGRGVGEKSVNVGLVKIESLGIGGATLRHQVFYVFPLASLASVEGVSAEGLVGYEVFKRFVVKVDYQHRLLTLALPSQFNYRGNGVIVPFQFNGHIPEVDGEVDGIPGKFDIDTGSRSSLDLLAPFVAQHDLKARYAPEIDAVTGWGVGGAARSLVTRAKVLRLGQVQVDRPVTELSLQKKGAFTDRYVAGNVGAGVLKRFNITFDYARQVMIFQRNANYAKPDTFDRSGMWLNLANNSYAVMDVVRGGPAARAGIRVGDRILTVNGQGPEQLPLPALRHMLRSDPPGTRLRLIVRTGTHEREVNLILKNLI